MATPKTTRKPNIDVNVDTILQHKTLNSLLKLYFYVNVKALVQHETLNSFEYSITTHSKQREN
jgi:hypothetical protein